MKLLGSLALVLVLAGCGVSPAGPAPAGDAPTGVAPGVTLYFLDADEHLVPQPRRTSRLGTIAEGVSLLLAGPGGSELRTDIAAAPVTQVVVTTGPAVITIRLPLASYEIGRHGIDQVVCTALGIHVQSGGARSTEVRLELTTADPGTDVPRTCPLIS